ncbi:hypothetical protein V6N13_113905 [Hibiscus sabdariffa]|uniref:RNase H type-1 domain-containing protein n=1 Tax=Hibiscus sabdariffa TaxID=183260 RepID=A0ABR2U069_9ROSI
MVVERKQRGGPKKQVDDAVNSSSPPIVASRFSPIFEEFASVQPTSVDIFTRSPDTPAAAKGKTVVSRTMIAMKSKSATVIRKPLSVVQGYSILHFHSNSSSSASHPIPEHKSLDRVCHSVVSISENDNPNFLIPPIYPGPTKSAMQSASMEQDKQHQALPRTNIVVKLMTNLEHQCRYLCDSVSYSRCSFTESMSHVLRDCSYARQVWGFVVPETDSHPDCTAHRAIIWARHYYYAISKLQQLPSSLSVVFPCQWSPPHLQWIFLNADGGVCTTTNLDKTGGLLRDSCGTWICGYGRSIGIANVFTVELWVIHDGLLAAWELGFKFVQVQSDCAKAISALSANNAS